MHKEADNEENERISAKKPENNCHECAMSIQVGEKFCKHCGSEILTVQDCSRCGKIIKSNDKFCNSCGLESKSKSTERNQPCSAKPNVKKSWRLINRIVNEGKIRLNIWLSSKKTVKEKLIGLTIGLLILGNFISYGGKTEISWGLTVYGYTASGVKRIWEKGDKVIVKGNYYRSRNAEGYDDGPNGEAEFGMGDDKALAYIPKEDGVNFITNLKMEFDNNTMEMMKLCEDTTTQNGSFIEEELLVGDLILQAEHLKDGFKVFLSSLGRADFTCVVEPFSADKSIRVDFTDMDLRVRRPLMATILYQLSTLIFIGTCIAYLLELKKRRSLSNTDVD
ncbi:MAG: zinc ribbon domain-containing protein [Proteobacteria bacterium]|nr:zinc ribbon domain-containing protein [Pseudomonadota bacterium]